jgi:hypothetical protein
MNCEVICFNSFCIVLLTESSSPIAPQTTCAIVRLNYLALFLWNHRLLSVEAMKRGGHGVGREALFLLHYRVSYVTLSIIFNALISKKRKKLVEMRQGYPYLCIL